MEEHVEQAVVQMAIDNPALEQIGVSNELRKKGILISPGEAHSIWLRHDMETFQEGLKALSDKVEQEGIILDEDQVTSLEKAKKRSRLMGRQRLFIPASLSPKTLAIWNISKVSVGHVYQQTVIDT